MKGTDNTETATAKPTNPKDLIGTNKVPLSLFPATAVAVGSVAMLDGALKYGRDNYRAIGVRASIYVDACLRHLTAWMEGEDCTTDSKVDHLGHALACLAIIIDAQAAGKLHDDRKIKGGYAETIARLTPMVAALREQHADKAPYHYTIADNPEPSLGYEDDTRPEPATVKVIRVRNPAYMDGCAAEPHAACNICYRDAEPGEVVDLKTAVVLERVL